MIKNLLRSTRYLLFIALLSPLFTSAQAVRKPASTVAEGYDLKFRISNMKDSLCFLANYYGDKQYLKDSAVSVNGVVEFRGKEALAPGIYLFVFPNKTYFEMMVDKEQHFSMECSMSDIIPTMKVKGSQDNIDFYSYLNFISERSKEVEPLKAKRTQLAADHAATDSVDAQIKAVDKKVADYKNNYAAAHPGSILAAVFKASQEPVIPEAPLLPNGKKDSVYVFRQYKEHYFDNLNLSDERLLRSPIYHSKVSNYMKNLVLQMPDSIIKEADSIIAKASHNKETFKYMIWYMTNTYETSNIMGMDQVFVHLVKHYYTKEIAYWVDEATLYKIQDRANILEPILLGKKVKNLVLEDTSGVFRSLYDVNKDFTILFFWDPDCGHCKKAVPVLKTIYDKVRSKGVEVYAVCTEVEMDKWRAFIKENKLEWINVGDPKLHNNFRHDFDISTTPQIFVLDKDKKILFKRIDVETLEKVMDKELAKKSD